MAFSKLDLILVDSAEAWKGGAILDSPALTLLQLRIILFEGPRNEQLSTDQITIKISQDHSKWPS